MKAGRITYRAYLLLLLGILLAFNLADRVALGLVLQNIKAAFQLSDTQLGVLSGLAFALFYSILGIPFGRWADRGNRVVIVAVSAAIGSIMVMSCSAAASFTELLLIRIGAAVGEAGGMPPAFSLIGDYFTRAERPRAVANYLLGGVLSVVIGYFLGGWLSQAYGWRVMFGVLGFPGLALAAVAALTLREPRLGPRGQGARSMPEPHLLGMEEVGRALWANRTFRNVLLMLSINSFFGYGIAQWLPSFFVRSYGIGTGELGIWLSAIYGIGGLIGLYGGGLLASRYAPGNEMVQLRVIAPVVCIIGAMLALVYLSHSVRLSFILLSVVPIGANLVSGPLLAVTQSAVPQRMRGVSISVVFFFGNLIGMGLGPLAVGALSDALRPWLAVQSLKYALLAMCPGYLWGAWHLWLAARTVMEDIDAACRS